MTWANALTIADLNDLVAESTLYEPKTGFAYVQLMVRLRRYGSVQDDAKMLASIGRCTMHWWTHRAWPVLRDVFEVHEGRIYHPDVAALRATRAPQPPAETEESPRRASARRAAQARWGNAPELGSDMNASHDASATHAPGDAISTTYASAAHASASAAHAIPHASASAAHGPAHAVSHALGMPGASLGALAVSRAPSLSLEDSVFSDSPESEEESLRESGSVRASANASGMRSDASPHAESHAQPMRRSLKSHHPVHASDEAATRIPADWAPSAADRLEAQRHGYDPDVLAPAFRDYNLGTGNLSPNWSAKWRTWVRREAPRPPSRQTTMAMPLAGGAATSPTAAAPPSDAENALRKRHVAMVTVWYQRGIIGLAPTFQRLLEAGADGIGWLAGFEAWVAGGSHGDRPADLGEQVRAPT